MGTVKVYTPDAPAPGMAAWPGGGGGGLQRPGDERAGGRAGDRGRGGGGGVAGAVDADVGGVAERIAAGGDAGPALAGLPGRTRREAGVGLHGDRNRRAGD